MAAFPAASVSMPFVLLAKSYSPEPKSARPLEKSEKSLSLNHPSRLSSFRSLYTSANVAATSAAPEASVSDMPSVRIANVLRPAARRGSCALKVDKS